MLHFLLHHLILDSILQKYMYIVLFLLLLTMALTLPISEVVAISVLNFSMEPVKNPLTVPCPTGSKADGMGMTPEEMGIWKLARSS